MPGPAETFLDALTTTVLLGSDRAGALPQSIPPGRLAHRAAALRTDDKESALLDLAAAASPWHRAGRPTDAAAATSDPAPPETLPDCPPGAAALLGRTLAGEHAGTLAEWLDLARRRGIRAREDHLPDLLDAGKAHPDLREAVAAVIGARGRWLAAQHDDWAYAAGDAPGSTSDPDAAWQTGTRDQRLILLRHLRRADPARALALLQSTWPTDPPDDRARFLPELAEGLSPADEPFLESCLDDKRKPVRTAAANLLARLPASAFVQRMIDRAGPHLTIEKSRKGLLKKTEAVALEATLPASFDKSWARDGIEEKPPGGTGQKAWWLQQLLAFIPPSHWSRAAGREPQTLIDSAAAHDLQAPILSGWIDAAERCRDADWAAALALWRPPLKARRSGAILHSPDALLGVLPPPHRETTVLAALPSAPRDDAWQLVDACDQPWSLDFTKAVLAFHAAQPKAHLPILDWTGRMHPAAAPDLLALLDAAGQLAKLPPSEKRAVDHLEFRAQLHREFAP